MPAASTATGSASCIALHAFHQANRRPSSGRRKVRYTCGATDLAGLVHLQPARQSRPRAPAHEGHGRGHTTRSSRTRRRVRRRIAAPGWEEGARGVSERQRDKALGLIDKHFGSVAAAQLRSNKINN
jgi:hypothetical protein